MSTQCFCLSCNNLSLNEYYIYLYITGIIRSALEYSVNGTGRGEPWRRLADLCDNFGARFAGTLALEKAIGKSYLNLKHDYNFLRKHYI